MITVPITKNLVDILWKERPHPEIKELIVLSKGDVGEDVTSKMKRVRTEYAKKKCDSIIVADLAEIACRFFDFCLLLKLLSNPRLGLFNLRGADIPFNPVFFSVAVVTNDSAHLFIDERKLSDATRKHLGGVEIHPYESVIEWLSKFHADAKKCNPEHKVFITSSTNYAWGRVINDEHAYVGSSPILFMKAVKNEAELNGMRDSHVILHY